MMRLIITPPRLTRILKQHRVIIHILRRDDEHVRQRAVDVDALPAGRVLIEHLSDLRLRVVEDGHVEVVVGGWVVGVGFLVLDDVDAAPAGVVVA